MERQAIWSRSAAFYGPYLDVDPTLSGWALIYTSIVLVRSDSDRLISMCSNTGGSTS